MDMKTEGIAPTAAETLLQNLGAQFEEALRQQAIGYAAYLSKDTVQPEDVVNSCKWYMQHPWELEAKLLAVMPHGLVHDALNTEDTE